MSGDSRVEVFVCFPKHEIIKIWQSGLVSEVYLHIFLWPFIVLAKPGQWKLTFVNCSSSQASCKSPSQV